MKDELKSGHPAFHSSFIFHPCFSRLCSASLLAHDSSEDYSFSLFLICLTLCFSGLAALVHDALGLFFGHAGRQSPGPDGRPVRLISIGNIGRRRRVVLRLLLFRRGLRLRRVLSWRIGRGVRAPRFYGRSRRSFYSIRRSLGGCRVNLNICVIERRRNCHAVDVLCVRGRLRLVAR